MNTALEYSTRVVQEGGRRCKKSTLNDLVHLTSLRIPLTNPPTVCIYCTLTLRRWGGGGHREDKGATVHKYSPSSIGGNSSQAG
jgi:hypothetical protein